LKDRSPAICCLQDVTCQVDTHEAYKIMKFSCRFIKWQSSKQLVKYPSM
jgi:hypothetical protein